MSAQGALTNIIACEGVDIESCRCVVGAKCTVNATRFFVGYDQRLLACCEQYANQVFMDADEISFEDMVLRAIHLS